VVYKFDKSIDISPDLDSQINPENLLKKSKQELITLLLDKNDLQIPISLFLSKTAPLESLVKYLKDEKKIEIKTIAKRLNRNIQTIFTTYRNAKKQKISFNECGQKVPLYIFSKDDKSILESLVFYMKDSLGLRFCEISKNLNRDNRTVWIYYHRYIAKTRNKVQLGGEKYEGKK
jgi:hypothetical protein